MDELIQLLTSGALDYAQIAAIVFVAVQLLKGAGWTKIMPGESTDERMSRLTLALSMVFSFLVTAKDAEFDGLTAEAVIEFIFAGLVSGLGASLFYRQLVKRFAGLFYAEDSLKGGQDAVSG